MSNETTRNDFTPFHVDELLDVPGFARVLKDVKLELSKCLRQHLPEKVRARIIASSESDLNTRDFEITLLKALNSVVRDTALYQHEVFKSSDMRALKLRPEILDLLSQNPRGKDRERLNRLLLEDLYPHFLSRRLSKPSEYRNVLSLQCVAEALAKVLKENDEIKRFHKFCLGVHVRHVFDTSAPTVHIETHPGGEESAQHILEANEGRGNQTLNHVLDSLLETCTDDTNPDLATFVTVAFNLPHEHTSEHPFDCKTPKLWEDPFREQLAGFKGKPKTCSAECRLDTIKRFSPTLGKDPDVDLDPVDYYCGSTKFCHQMNIPVAPLSLSSIWRAVIQLGQYAGEGMFGKHTATFLLRGSNPFGFIVGFTLICDSKEPVSPDKLTTCFKAVREVHAALNYPEGQLRLTPPASATCGVVLNTIRKYRGPIVEDQRASQVPPSVVNLVVSELIRDCTKADEDPFTFLEAPEGLSRSVQSFLILATQFCDERVEGRDLCFGFVHGNPYLMFHWDGPSPIPLSVRGNFLSLVEMPRQFHLIEAPEDRCVVFPFIPPRRDPEHPGSAASTTNYELSLGDPIPAYALELKHFKDAFGASDQIQLWSEEFRPYAYFTHRHRWATACVVGPHSELRVFVRGNLVVYRDGKGWKTLRKLPRDATTLKEVQEECILEPWKFIAKQNQGWWQRIDLLQRLIELAVQLSPFANRHAKGGLIVYAPEMYSTLEVPDPAATDKPTSATNLWYDGTGNRIVQDLKPVDPDHLPGEGDSSWLGGRPLLIRSEESEGDQHRYRVRLDEEVAHRLLRACTQDGGAIICKREGVIQGFAKRLTPPATETNQAGTKRTTAIDYVNLVQSSAALNHDSPSSKGLGLGIAISSDGGITIAYTAEDTGGNLKTQTLVLFESI